MWLAEANVVERFIGEACDRIDPSLSQYTTSFAYDAFIRWSLVNGVQERHRPQLNTFGKRFEELGYRVKHTKDGSSIFGVSIKDEWANVTLQVVGWTPTR